VKGIVYLEELPLNISRDMLHQKKIMKVIRKTLEKNRVNLIIEIADNTKDYNKYYEAFSKNIKLLSALETFYALRSGF